MNCDENRLYITSSVFGPNEWFLYGCSKIELFLLTIHDNGEVIIEQGGNDYE